MFTNHLRMWKESGSVLALVAHVLVMAAIWAGSLFEPADSAGQGWIQREPNVRTREVQVEEARSELPREWVWEVKPVTFDHMFRSAR